MSIKLQNTNIFFSLSPTILVFDSGVGGLSIYNKIRKELPNLHYIYAFDNIGFPYGEKSENFILDRVIEITTALQKYHSLGLMVIACNTVSTVSLSVLREIFQFPIVGVVPAIKPAAHLTKNGIIGLLATHVTIRQPYTHKLISLFASQFQIEILDSAELVKLAEKKLYGETVPIKLLKKILLPWLQMTEPPDTVVLGCTHFTLLQNELLSVLPRKTRLVNSDIAIARRILWILDRYKVVWNEKSTKENIAYCMTITSEVKKLIPIFHWYGFTKFETLIL